jgi:uncharacterized protein
MIKDTTQHLAVMTVSIHIPSSQSLKDKRMVLKSIKDKIRAQFNVSVAELGDLDKWQVSILGFAMLSSDQPRIDSAFQNILSFLEGVGTFNLCEHQIDVYS